MARKEVVDEHRGWRIAQPLGAWWVLPVGLVVASVVLLSGGLRSFGYAMAITLALAGVIRLVTPAARAGGLIVRSRAWDVAMLVVLSAACATLSFSLVIR
ncbi:MAG: DUF3017 domain-containing protein [Ornithinimicrobium sp.]